MPDEVYERLRDMEIMQGRQDERLKGVEAAFKEMKDLVGNMRVQVAVIVAGLTLGIQVLFKLWK